MGAKTEPQSEDGLLEELELIAGQPLSSLPPSQMNVVREALADHQAQRRLLSLNELPLFEFLRRPFPELFVQGLDQSPRPPSFCLASFWVMVFLFFFFSFF